MLSVDLITHIISVPKADLTLISGTLYEHDTNAFRLELKSWEDSEEGITQPKTHNHNTAVTVAGTTYARAIVMLPPYSVCYENGQYTVILKGSNNNIFDVANGCLVQNEVQIIPTNSAGLIQVTSGSGVTAQDKTDIINGVWDEALDTHIIEGSSGQLLTTAENLIGIIAKLTGNKVTKAGNIITVYEDDELSIWRQYDLTDGQRVQV